MDKECYWKRTEDIEIDMLDLLRRFCRKWKQIAACALACAMIFGVYGWLKTRNSLDEEVSATEEAELTEKEEQAVAAAILLEHEIQELETYLDDSVLMKIDPYHKTRFVMLYSIDHAERREIQKITESYLNFILNGGAADAFQESGKWKMDKTYLAELLGAYQKTYSFPDEVVIDNTGESKQMAETIFYVEVTGRDAASAEKMAGDMQEVLMEYSAKLEKTAGSHRLMLVNNMESITADSSLQSQQRDKKNQLLSNKTNLKAMTDAFNDEQMAAYNRDSSRKDKEEHEKTGKIADGGNFRTYIIYFVLGFTAGVFVYSCMYVCWYVFSDTVKSSEQLKAMYVFPFYGEIGLGRRDKNAVRAALVKKQDALEHETAQVLNRIRLSCKKQGIAGMYAVSDFSLDIQEKECLESMAKQLHNWGIAMLLAENASEDTAEWDNLAETGHVLMVCRIGKTTHRMIDDAMSFYLENGISVMGTAAFIG